MWQRQKRLEVRNRVADIKTKNTARDIKVSDRAARVGTYMKNAAGRIKGAAESADSQSERTQEAGCHSPSGYAIGRVSSGARTTAETAVKSAAAAADSMNKAKQQSENARQQLPKARKQAAEQARQTAKKAQKTAKDLKGRADQARQTANKAQKSVQEAKQTLIRTRQSVRQTTEAARKTIKTSGRAEKGIKQSVKAVKATGKNSVKAAKKGVKTAQQTAKVAAKTAKYAAIAAKRAEQAARAATKAAIKAAKVATRVVIATVKAIIAATKALISAIAAGSWVAVVIVLITCMIGLLAGSAFGIFFSGEDSGSGHTMPMAIQEINGGYADKITEIRNSNAHGGVQMSGTRAEWKEVLAVYAVKVNTDPDSAQDVAAMDEGKKELLRSVFWDMNTISCRTETKEVTEVTAEDDGNEDSTSTDTTGAKTILYITVSHKAADEMAARYGFNAEQKAQLAELLSDEYAGLWSAVLYGTRNGSSDIVAVAAAQIGNVTGEPYWSWYGFDSRVEWCAAFVSWCANECGYIDAGIIPRFASCQSQGIPWFTERGLYQTDNGYLPRPGDIIFFDWEQDGYSDHVGIVEYAEGGTVHTLEGNAGADGAVMRHSYRLSSAAICGYGAAGM